MHDAEVAGEFDARTDKHILRISRRHHGNIKSSVITPDFVHGADYEALADAGRHLPRPARRRGAMVKRGEGERQKEAKVGDFRAGHGLADGAGRSAPSAASATRAWAR